MGEGVGGCGEDRVGRVWGNRVGKGVGEDRVWGGSGEDRVIEGVGRTG